MKFTLNAFGQPFEFEWISDDGRVLSSRTKSFQLHSFPYLEEWDTFALSQNNIPVKLTRKWIQHPRSGDEVRWPANALAQTVPVIYREYEVPPMPLHDALLKTNNIRFGGHFLELYFTELIQGTIKCGSPNSPEDLCWRIVSTERYGSATGLFVVEATLEDGKVIFLADESRRERLVPLAAQQYFINQQIVSHSTATEAPAEDDELLGPITPPNASAKKPKPSDTEVATAKVLQDLTALSIDAKWELARILDFSGIKASVVSALVGYAFGKITAVEAARLGDISKRHFYRLKMGIPDPYKQFFFGTRQERAARATMHSAAKFKEASEEVAKLVEALREKRQEDEDDANENNPWSEEFYPLNHITPVRRSQA